MRESKVFTVSVFGLAHALVDAICAAILFSIYKFGLTDGWHLFYWTVFYNVLAFGTQFIFGYILDKKYFDRKQALLFSLFLIMAPLFFYKAQTFLAIWFLGLGNSIFHVASGSIVLRLSGGRATWPGLYVAPGAIGLALGSILAKKGLFSTLPWFLVWLAVFTLSALVVENKEKIKWNFPKVDKLMIVSFLILLSVVIRSLIGLAISFSWKSNFVLLIVLTLAVAGGKALGGVLADRFGWIKIGFWSLLISAPLLAFGKNIPAVAITGVLLFNMTMPITLTALFRMMPEAPGFAFGLTCLALLLGGLPAFTPYKALLDTVMPILIITSFSAVLILFSLRKLFVKSSDILKA